MWLLPVSLPIISLVSMYEGRGRGGEGGKEVGKEGGEEVKEAGIFHEIGNSE